MLRKGRLLVLQLIPRLSDKFPGIHLDLSPNACIAVAEGFDRNLYLKKLEVQIPGPDAFNSQCKLSLFRSIC